MKASDDFPDPPSLLSEIPSLRLPFIDAIDATRSRLRELSANVRLEEKLRSVETLDDREVASASDFREVDVDLRIVHPTSRTPFGSTSTTSTTVIER